MRALSLPPGASQRHRLARSDRAHVELAVAADHEEALADGGDCRAAFRQRIGVERQPVRVEPVEGRGLTLGVDRDKGQRAADADGSLDLTTVREVLIGRRGHEAPPSPVRRSTAWV